MVPTINTSLMMTGSVAALFAQVAIVYTSTGMVTGWINCLTNGTGSERIQGYYVMERKELVICDHKTVKARNNTVFHELWHHLYFSQMPQIERDRWLKLSAAKTNPSAYLTWYAATSPIEDFAETFAFIAIWKKEDVVSWYPEWYQERLLKINFVRRMILKYGH